MQTIDLVYDGDHQYAEIRNFANEIYECRLGAGANYRPQLFLVLYDHDKTLTGCMGLNSQVNSPLFCNDLRFQQYKNSLTGQTHLVDQAFFAVDGCRLASRTLIAASAAYAEAVGIHRIVYAGAAIFGRMIERIGLKVSHLGAIDLQVVPTEMGAKMEQWRQMYDPQLCAMHTSNGKSVCANWLRNRDISVSATFGALLNDTQDAA